ncbi:conserved hypothetical protein [Chryseobacterium sp. 8AT]|nr:conserved hypothetical protein [Chryseobacterium sp. 8AT]
MTKFFTFFSNLRSSINNDFVKELFFKAFNKWSRHLFSKKNILKDIQKNSLIDANYIGIQFHFNN